MAFLLRDIPDAATFERFAERYPRLDPLATEAFLRCMRTGSDLLEFLDRHLERSALRHGGWITLILLMREPDHTASPSDLAKKQGVRRPTMTGLLGRLERDGLVERVDHGADARSSPARLTRKGITVLDAIMPDYYAAVAELMSVYSVRELTQLVALLRKAPLASSRAAPSTDNPSCLPHEGGYVR